VNIYNEAGEVVRHLFAYADDPGNLTLGNVQLSSTVIAPTASTVATAQNRVVFTLSNGQTLVWDGKGDDGSIVTNGVYVTEIHWTDGKGGEEVVSKSVVVQNRGGDTTAVVAAPNVLTSGAQSTTIRVNPANGYTLTVTLYDIAGELVKTPLTGPASGDQVGLDASGLASGVYYAVVTVTDAAGHNIQKQTLPILIKR
jgi:flagellar hook assembly protein FlgD